MDLLDLPKLCRALTLSLAAFLIGADAFAQELSLLEGFGDGFLFHWVFASGRKPNIDGSITYWQEDNAGAVTLRQSPGDPCVFHVNVLNLRPTRNGAALIDVVRSNTSVSTLPSADARTWLFGVKVNNSRA